MAVFKQISIEVALRKIASDLGYTKTNSSEFPWQDAVEWIAEALGQIGAYTQYNVKEITLTIEDYKSKLPADFIYMKRILNSDYNTPYGISDNRNENLLTNPTDGLTDTANRLLGNAITDFDYNIVLDNIIVSYQSGTLKLQYLAMPTDTQGLPLIPDNESYKEAFLWKVARQLAIRGKLPNKELTIEYTDSQWQWYCGQARSEGNAFTHEQLDWHAADNMTFLPLSRIMGDLVINSPTAVSSFAQFGETT